jgi:hypothetical protein
MAAMPTQQICVAFVALKQVLIVVEAASTNGLF